MHQIAKFSVVAALLLLTACSSMNPFSRKTSRGEPASLVSFKPTMAVSNVWTASLGKSDNYVFTPALVNGQVFAASADGTVISLDATSGKSLWRINAGMDLTAGVGSDGLTVVVAGADGVILAFDAANGNKRWKAQASTEVLSAPAVGGGMVVVRSLDNRLIALDTETGVRRWFLQRPSPALTLRAASGIVIKEGIAYAGMPGGRLLAVAIANGAPRWEAAIAEPRGATELERVADVSGTPVIAGKEICAASYQGRIACADISNGALRWAREISTEVGTGIDERFVFAADERGNLLAYARDSGASQWRNTSLSWRGLSAPVSLGRAVVVGDSEGYLHFLSREEGAMLARVKTGEAIKATPIVAGSNLIIQTQGGKVIALKMD
jgi:outer membrane protein assembly factor BamB